VERVSPASAGETAKVTVSGKHCETDKLFEDVELPADVKAGDLLQVLCTGAYNSSMASNYNRYRRPPTVLLRSNGSADLIQRSETWDELLAREIVPADLAGTP
jgi:diaminopimelate decarboxylase